MKAPNGTHFVALTDAQLLTLRRLLAANSQPSQMQAPPAPGSWESPASQRLGVGAIMPVYNETGVDLPAYSVVQLVRADLSKDDFGYGPDTVRAFEPDGMDGSGQWNALGTARFRRAYPLGVSMAGIVPRNSRAVDIGVYQHPVAKGKIGHAVVSGPTLAYVINPAGANDLTFAAATTDTRWLVQHNAIDVWPRTARILAPVTAAIDTTDAFLTWVFLNPIVSSVEYVELTTYGGSGGSDVAAPSFTYNYTTADGTAYTNQTPIMDRPIGNYAAATSGLLADGYLIWCDEVEQKIGA